MRLYEHNVVRAWSFPVALLKTSSIFILSFVFFFQLRLGSQSTYSYCRSSTFVCTGQRLVRARVVLWSTPGLASMKHFAIFSSNAYSRGVFFYLGYYFFQACFSSTRANPGFCDANKLYFYPSTGGLETKNKKTKQKKTTAARLIRTCSYIFIYTLRILWYNYQVQHDAVLLHVVGTQEIEIQYYTAVCVCTYACARTRCI